MRHRPEFANATKKSVVILISGRGSNMQALLEAELPCCRVAAVISNKADATGLDTAQQHGIATQVVMHRDYPDRESFDAALAAAIDRYQPDLVVLAGFMRILTAGFVAHYHGRLINIHPSLLPDLPGMDTHRRAIESGRTEHGASVHFVTPEVDGGPVIAQARVPVRPDDNAATLATRVLEQEHRLYPQVLRWFAEGRLHWVDGRIHLDGQVLQQPVICTDAGQETTTC